MNHDNYPDSYIRGILKTVKTIAMVGISPKDNRPSYFAFKYLLDRGYHDRRLPLERIADLVAASPARRFRIAGKGTIDRGNDADLVLIDTESSFTLQEDHLQQRHKTSPYLGATFRGVVRATLRRGETIFMDGQVTAAGGGRFVRPDAAL